MTYARIKFRAILAKKRKFNEQSFYRADGSGVTSKNAVNSTAGFDSIGRGLYDSQLCAINHYEFSSCLRLNTLGYSTKTYLKLASNDEFLRVVV